MKKNIFLMVLMMLFSLMGCKKKESLAPPSVVPSVPAPPETQPLPTPPFQILSPMDSIKDLDKKIESYKTGANLSPQDVEDNKKLKEQIIRGTFDIYELSRLALDVHWNAISEQERNNFSTLMTNLLEKKAIFSKEQVKGTEKPYQIVYKKEEYLDPTKQSARVATILSIPSEKIDLNINYKLKVSPMGWKIFDVIVDEASLVENYKFQFDTIIKKYGFADLVARMQKKLKEME